MPTRSAVRKQALRARAVAGPATASTSSTVMPSAIVWWMALHIEKTPMRLATKLGVSLAWTTPLPRRCSTNAATEAVTAGSVWRLGTTSTSRM